MRTLFILVLSTALITGCATTVNDVNVNYKYQNTSNYKLSDQVKNKIKIGPVTDGRYNSSKFIFHYMTLNGSIASGGYEADKPFTDIIRDGLIQGLASVKAPMVESGENLQLNGTLLSYSSQWRMGWISSTVESRMRVLLTLKDATNNKEVWTTTVEGFASYEPNDEGAQIAVKQIIDQIVTNLINNKYFIQLLSMPSGAPN